MSVKGERIGAIELINKRGGDGLFDDNDLLPFAGVVFLGGLRCSQRADGGSLVEQERVKRELELAAEIQRSLLPPASESVVSGQRCKSPGARWSQVIFMISIRSTMGASPLP